MRFVIFVIFIWFFLLFCLWLEICGKYKRIVLGHCKNWFLWLEWIFEGIWDRLFELLKRVNKSCGRNKIWVCYSALSKWVHEFAFFHSHELILLELWITFEVKDRLDHWTFVGSPFSFFGVHQQLLPDLQRFSRWEWIQDHCWVSVYLAFHLRLGII